MFCRCGLAFFGSSRGASGSISTNFAPQAAECHTVSPSILGRGGRAVETPLVLQAVGEVAAT